MPSVQTLSLSLTSLTSYGCGASLAGARSGGGGASGDEETARREGLVSWSRSIVRTAMAEASEIGAGHRARRDLRITELLGQGGMGAVWTAQAPAAAGQARRDQGAARRRGERSRVVRALSPRGGDRVAHRPSEHRHGARLQRAAVGDAVPGARVSRGRGSRAAARARQACRSTTALGDRAADRLARCTRRTKRDVVHRDLKPRQHLPGADARSAASSSSRCKVLDFGISKIRGLADGADAGVGAARHAAVHGAGAGARQEHARSTRAPTSSRSARSSTRCCRGGRRSWARRSPRSCSRSCTTSSRRSRSSMPSLPKNVVDAVEQALAKDVNARFSDVGAFINALTGRPLQTLDRARAKNPAPEAFASTQAASGGALPSPPSTGARGEITPSIPIPPTTAPAAQGIGRQEGGVHRGRAVGGDRRHGRRHEADGEAAGARSCRRSWRRRRCRRRSRPRRRRRRIDAAAGDRRADEAEGRAAVGEDRGRPAKKETLPPEVASELDAAEKSIDGDPARGDSPGAPHAADGEVEPRLFDHRARLLQAGRSRQRQGGAALGRRRRSRARHQVLQGGGHGSAVKALAALVTLLAVRWRRRRRFATTSRRRRRRARRWRTRIDELVARVAKKERRAEPRPDARLDAAATELVRVAPRAGRRRTSWCKARCGCTASSSRRRI